MSIIGQQIKKYRIENGFTQEQVGKIIGVTTQAVSKWERGSTPDAEILPLIADALGVSVDALYGREERSFAVQIAKKLCKMQQDEAYHYAFGICWAIEIGLSGEASAIDDFMDRFIDRAFTENEKSADYFAKLINDSGIALTRSLSPCDNIFTHFPADENQTVNLGRLGEESKRISEIFSLATDKSLLLFNESLATTSFTEGLYIAKDVVKAMRSLGARTIFNTHMHELAMDLDEINALNGKIKVASLVTGIHEGQRSYKVYLAPPDGISYARDIAEKYGVTYSQLMQAAG